jgi:hypothetical protein
MIYMSLEGFKLQSTTSIVAATSKFWNFCGSISAISSHFSAISRTAMLLGLHFKTFALDLALTRVTD